MGSKKFNFHDGKKGTALAVVIIPRAKKNEVVGILEDGSIKIRITAPPVEGKANTALVNFLSSIMDIPSSKIEIVAGMKGRHKLVSILDLDARIVQERIVAQINQT